MFKHLYTLDDDDMHHEILTNKPHWNVQTVIRYWVCFLFSTTLTNTKNKK